MNFTFNHEFVDWSVKAFETIYFDEPFNVRLCQQIALSRDLIDLEINPHGPWRRCVRVRPSRQLPAAVRRFIGVEQLNYTEEINYQPQLTSGSWKVTSSIYPEKVMCTGTLAFIATPQGCNWQTQGSVQVNIFGVGQLIERLIVEDMKSSYDKAAQYIRSTAKH